MLKENCEKVLVNAVIRIINSSTDVGVIRTNLSLVYCRGQTYLLVNTGSAVLLMLDKVRL